MALPKCKICYIFCKASHVPVAADSAGMTIFRTSNGFSVCTPSVPSAMIVRCSPAKLSVIPRGLRPEFENGFTLIELLMTIAILGVLALIIVPGAQVLAQRDREKELRLSLIQIRTAIDAYKRVWDDGRIQRNLGDSGYPKRLDDLVEGVADIKSPNRQTIYFLRRIPRDPFSTEPEHVSPGDTWGKRAYASPPDQPAEGDDVFDVFTKSTAMGLNGSLLGRW